ncbi:NAD(P)-binding protein [Marasmius fiardii PR-910]|nr:NAD(P)-binding protein [Marasmius fiardii PR-910]
MSSPQPLQGVAAVLANSATSSIYSLFALTGRVALVTGGERGIGLEIALAFAEAGAVVYCLDKPTEPGEDWLKVKRHLEQLAPLEGSKKPSLHYVHGDVTNQQAMWKIVDDIVAKEGRIDVCFANAGILQGYNCLEYPAEEFQKVVMDVNVNGVLFTAQAVGRHMERLGTPGSIIMTASMSGTITNPRQSWVAYNTSKSAVLQMARSMACELAPKGIRVNTLSPGYILTNMTQAFLDTRPELWTDWKGQNPSGRIGRPDELRGAALWLASDASTFCTGSDIRVDGGQTAW